MHPDALPAAAVVNLARRCPGRQSRPKSWIPELSSRLSEPDYL